MYDINIRLLKPFILVFVMLMLASCTAGDGLFIQDNPAGFWYGLWHGVISVVTLVIHLFNENVLVYEVNNVGGWYDFGFLLGVICIWGGSSHVNCKSSEKKQREKEWDEIGEKVEKKVMRRLKAWSEDEEGSGSSKEWDEIGEKVEKKLKRKIREWAEKE
ncbi:hypothetical protein BOW14_09675 [Solemya velum gill symbiont]|uniref:hypothetical protein n=1 Tax=Solemya velum gill symbiont TaxID=2340 RepID=UPI0009D1DB2E|nr:hypothetical protein [Solemya velum gill symbiont]OOY85753.1 hypothetical protein BOW14_09675 [Solemya velum gill symbiont]